MLTGFPVLSAVPHVTVGTSRGITSVSSLDIIKIFINKAKI